MPGLQNQWLCEDCLNCEDSKFMLKCTHCFLVATNKLTNQSTKKQWAYNTITNAKTNYWLAFCLPRLPIWRKIILWRQTYRSCEYMGGLTIFCIFSFPYWVPQSSLWLMVPQVKWDYLTWPVNGAIHSEKIQRQNIYQPYHAYLTNSLLTAWGSWKWIYSNVSMLPYHKLLLMTICAMLWRKLQKPWLSKQVQS